MKLEYKWLVELDVDGPFGGVVGHEYFDTFDEVAMQLNEPPPEECSYIVSFWRHDEYGTASAYVFDGKLPSHFVNIDGDAVAPVPLQFRQQVDRYYGA